MTNSLWAPFPNVSQKPSCTTFQRPLSSIWWREAGDPEENLKVMEIAGAMRTASPTPHYSKTGRKHMCMWWVTRGFQAVCCSSASILTTRHTCTTGQRTAIFHESLLYDLRSLRQGSAVTSPLYWTLIQGLPLNGVQLTCLTAGSWL